MKATAQVFLSYVREDEEKVENLYQKLSDEGFEPWMAKKDIFPGERWKSRIPQAIQHSDFFLVCLSANSVDKRGWIQKEIKEALDIWQEMLDSDIYLIPVRLEDCRVPERLGDFQWVNLFEEDGWTRLVRAIQVGINRRAKVPAGKEPARHVPQEEIVIPFSCEIDGKLHIYEYSEAPIMAGVPRSANIFIIGKQPLSATIVDESVDLSEGAQIEQLEFTMDYEYHADTAHSPAMLEFVMKDIRGNQIWSRKKSFLPGTLKTRITKDFHFIIGRKSQGLGVKIQVKPVRAGDFGFYIYMLNGTLVVKAE